MDVFAVHERVIADYRAFTSGFVDVRDDRINKFVAEQFAEGVQWPDPWLSLNPSLASGGSVTDLVQDGLLHRECERASSSPMTQAARTGDPYRSPLDPPPDHGPRHPEPPT